MLWNRIVAAGVPRPAAANATGDQPARMQNAMPLERHLGVFRAAGMKAAGRRQQRTHEESIRAHQRQQRPAN